jgi:curved DNA-binding protein CbpA
VTDDLYAVLDVSPGANLREIRAAFRRLARLHHPDVGGGSAERMAAVNRAYAILSDPEQRRRYDAQRAVGSVAVPAPEEPTVAPEDPPWRLDLERGDNLDDWRQMYAEERQVWEQLLRSRPTPDAQIQGALDRARRDQLELENAIRAQHDLAPLTPADLELELADVRQHRRAEATRAGCAVLPLSVVLRLMR